MRPAAYPPACFCAIACACAGYLLALPVWAVVQWYCLSLDQGSKEKTLYDWLVLHRELDDVSRGAVSTPLIEPGWWQARDTPGSPVSSHRGIRGGCRAVALEGAPSEMCELKIWNQRSFWRLINHWGCSSSEPSS